MNDTLIIVGIACMVIGCVLGYWSIRRYDGTHHGPWISLVALLSLATLAAVGRDGVDPIEQRVAGTESHVSAALSAWRLGISDNGASAKALYSRPAEDRQSPYVRVDNAGIYPTGW